MTISISDRARTHLQAQLAAGSGFLRVTVSPGGCSGMTYNASLAPQLGDDDEVVYEHDGIRVASDSFSKYFLNGLLIDYSDDLIKPGLALINRLATQSCGCGASFAL